MDVHGQNTRLNHIAVYVTDLEKSTHFYQHIIGLDTIPEPFHDGKHTWFAIGNAQLHLIASAPVKPVTDKNNHLCFSVPSIDAFIFKLNKEKVEFENWPGKKSSFTVRPDGVKQIWLKDPDGYWIEINDDKSYQF